jgi:hypothetical protein
MIWSRREQRHLALVLTTQGRAAGIERAGACLRYLVRYLTTSIGDFRQKVIQ